MIYNQEAKESRRSRKLRKVMLVSGVVLVLGGIFFPSPEIVAQVTGVETLGVGSPSTACNFTGPCVAPILAADGTLEGSIMVIASPGHLYRYDIAGNLLWSSTDYNVQAGTFTHDGEPGTLFYTGASKLVRCGGSGRWIQYCNYHWISGGTLTE